MHAHEGLHVRVHGVVRALHVCTTALLGSLAYLQRLLEHTHTHTHRAPALAQGDLYEVVIACVMCATKYLYDIPYSNTQWAVSSGVDRSLLNQHERGVLQGLGHSLALDRATLQHLHGDVHQGGLSPQYELWASCPATTAWGGGDSFSLFQYPMDPPVEPTSRFQHVFQQAGMPGSPPSLAPTPVWSSLFTCA